jgi:hypothetical protein
MLPAPAPRAAPGAGRSRAVELADIFRAHGAAYRQTHRLARAPRRAMRAIETCRTAALGGHRETCDACGAERIAYNSCLMGSDSLWGDQQSLRPNVPVFWPFRAVPARFPSP